MDSCALHDKIHLILFSSSTIYSYFVVKIKHFFARAIYPILLYSHSRSAYVCTTPARTRTYICTYLCAICRRRRRIKIYSEGYAKEERFSFRLLHHLSRCGGSAEAETQGGPKVTRPKVTHIGTKGPG